MFICIWMPSTYFCWCDTLRSHDLSVIVITPWGNGENLALRPTFVCTHFMQSKYKVSPTMFDVIVLINCLLHRFYEIRNDMYFLHCIRKLLTAVCFCSLCKWNMQSQLICLVFAVHCTEAIACVAFAKAYLYVWVCVHWSKCVNSPRCD